MTSKSEFREQYLSSLTECASSIMKRVSEGGTLTTTDALLLRMYKRELASYERVPQSQVILKILDFAKNNLSGLLSEV